MFFIGFRAYGFVMVGINNLIIIITTTSTPQQRLLWQWRWGQQREQICIYVVHLLWLHYGAHLNTST